MRGAKFCFNHGKCEMFNRNSKEPVQQVVDHKSVNFRGQVQTENVSFINHQYVYNRTRDPLGDKYKEQKEEILSLRYLRFRELEKEEEFAKDKEYLLGQEEI